MITAGVGICFGSAPVSVQDKLGESGSAVSWDAALDFQA